MASFKIALEDLAIEGKVETSREGDTITYFIILPNNQIKLMRDISGKWLTTQDDTIYHSSSMKAMEKYEQSLIK